MYRLFCLGHRFKKGWYFSKDFESVEDALKFLVFVKKKQPIYDEYYFYKIVNCYDGSYTYFKIVVGDYSNAVYIYDPDLIPAEVIL